MRKVKDTRWIPQPGAAVGPVVLPPGHRDLLGAARLFGAARGAEAGLSEVNDADQLNRSSTQRGVVDPVAEGEHVIWDRRLRRRNLHMGVRRRSPCGTRERPR